LAEYYKSYNPIVVHGQTDTEDLSTNEYRDNELTRFRTDPNCNLAIISPLCLGVGVNIPESSVAIHWDRSYSSVVYLQATGRNHRATSLKDVIQYILLFDNTLEIIQDGVLDGKVNLNNNLLKKDVLTNEEWNKIFCGKLDAYEYF
jgi:SNF2 family DNA or RNA helicase